MARKNRRPTFKSATIIVGEKGIITKLSSTLPTTIVGARTNTPLSANGGIQSSLKNNFSVSASTIKIPRGPARLGPSLSCHIASILLSTHIRPAAIFSSTNKTPSTIQICSIEVIILFFVMTNVQQYDMQPPLPTTTTYSLFTFFNFHPCSPSHGRHSPQTGRNKYHSVTQLILHLNRK